MSPYKPAAVYTLTDPRTGRDALSRYRLREGVL